MSRTSETPSASEILAACRSRTRAMVAELRALVEIETPSSSPECMEPLFSRLQGRLEDLGLECRRHPGTHSGGSLEARRAGADAEQLLLGHCDTVWPVGTLESMPITDDGAIFRGPGSFDMKAGLVQALFALEVLRDLGIEPRLAPRVLVNSDEEIGSDESRPLIEAAAREVDRCLVLEPALAPDGRLKTRRKGVMQFELGVTGRASHAGLAPEDGISAIQELALLIPRIHELHDPRAGVLVNVGTVLGGSRPNVVPAHAEAVIDVRVPTRDAAVAITGALQALVPSREGVVLQVRCVHDRPPLDPDGRGRALWSAARAAADDFGIELGEGTAGGGSDGNLTNPFTPTLDGLGAVGDGAHSADEHVVIERMPERCALLVALLTAPPVAELPGVEPRR